MGVILRRECIPYSLRSRGTQPLEATFMAGNKRPSFLKRQKEQQRQARAIEKREARLARRRGAGAPTEPILTDEVPEVAELGPEAEL